MMEHNLISKFNFTINTVNLDTFTNVSIRQIQCKSFPTRASVAANGVLAVLGTRTK